MHDLLNNLTRLGVIYETIVMIFLVPNGNFGCFVFFFFCYCGKIKFVNKILMQIVWFELEILFLKMPDLATLFAICIVLKFCSI